MTAALSGELEARFDGENRARVHASGPLELRGPLTASKLYYLRNVAAGVFEGDTYRTLLHCAAGAQARFESPSATKVYSMPSRGATTSVELCAEGGSRLVWGPHATILHTGASLRTDTRVTLHVGARVLMAETLVMCRIAAGQRFDFASYGSNLIVQDGRGDVLCREAFSLTRVLASKRRWAGSACSRVSMLWAPSNRGRWSAWRPCAQCDRLPA